MSSVNEALQPLLDQILQIIKEGNSFCLIGHQNPDADVIGGELVLASLIHRLGPDKKVEIYNNGMVPRYLGFLSGYSQVHNVQKVAGHFDVLISLECSGADRMGNILDLKTQVSKIINLDHHLSNSQFGHVNYVDPKASAIGELIFKIFDRSGLKMNREEAMSLYVGMVTDTGCFRYGNTTPETHLIAAKLIETGIPVGEISERVYMSRTEGGMKLFTYAFTHLKMELDNKVTVLFIPHNLLSEIKAMADDLEDVVNIGLQQDTVRVSILLREKTPNEMKVSLRSKGNVDIHQVAKKFGGGGHKNAAGCNLTGTFEDLKFKVLSEVKKIV